MQALEMPIGEGAIVSSHQLDPEEAIPVTSLAKSRDELQKEQEDWNSVKLCALVSTIVTVILSLCVAWQDGRRTKMCYSMAASFRSKQDSKALDIDLMTIPPNRKPEDEADLKAARLTHLVVPFHVSQEDQAKRLMETWKYFPPCRVNVDDESDLEHIEDVELKAYLREKTSFFRRNLGADHIPLGHKVSLIFFLNCGYDRSVESRLMDYFNVLPDSVKQCFSETKVRFANLKAEEDTYLSGSRNMFERMMNSLIGITEAKYAFYMEPDCRPVRPYWLSVVDSLCRFPNGKFWIKGSIFRGSMKAINQPLVHNLFHINGNAIYNLADQDFRDFYFKRVVPYVKSIGRQLAYDTDTFVYLLEPKFYELNKEIAHYFQFSDFMQNHWHADYSMTGIRNGSDITVLVHGGTPHV